MNTLILIAVYFFVVIKLTAAFFRGARVSKRQALDFQERYHACLEENKRLEAQLKDANAPMEDIRYNTIDNDVFRKYEEYKEKYPAVSGKSLQRKIPLKSVNNLH